MEPPLKKVKLHTAMQENVTVPCIMVSETLQHIAQQEDCYFIIHNVPKKQKSPYAQNPWFYNPDQNRKNKAKYLKKLSKKNSCKQLVVKAYQMKAEKLKNSTRLFEVEYIVDFKMINGQRYYLIKWVGWPNEANTWEPDDNLSCSHLIHDFHEDYTMQLYKFLDDRKISWNKLLSCQNKTKGVGVFQRLFNAIPSNFKYVSFYAEQKRKIVTELRTWQRKINDITKSCPLIAIENEVDLCSFPSDFKYTVTNIPGKDVFIPNDPLIGCDCPNGCSSRLIKNLCCPGTHHGRNPYSNKLVKVHPGKPIFECNIRCKCDMDCPNRVVQHGPHNALSIYRTSNGKGWGVKALEIIPKGSFVMEYVGEVIKNEEAERRGKRYDSEGMTYLFDLDYYDSENPLTVDATRFGNISHFVNHSCSPNLQVYNVFINNVDPSLPRIALFALRTISANEELTFDYQMTGDNSPDADKHSLIKRTRCLCGSSSCRGWLV